VSFSEAATIGATTFHVSICREVAIDRIGRMHQEIESEKRTAE
jgi:hypothetical protein